MRRHRQRTRGSHVAVLLTLSAVLTALVGARNTMLANDGFDHYQEAIPQEIKRGAAL
jgi:hypothetical protein